MILAAILIGLLLIVLAQLEMLRALDGLHALCLALGALKLQHDLPCRLCLLVEDRLGLPSETRLFLVVTSLPLCRQRSLSCLVLRDLVWSVLQALAAIRVSALWHVHHDQISQSPRWT